MTKGMWMIITGSVGLMLTFVWILVLIIRYRKQERKVNDANFNGEDGGNVTTQSPTSPDHVVPSTMLLEDMALADESTVLLDEANETEFLS